MYNSNIPNLKTDLTVSPPNEEVSHQIDRLNEALSEIMYQIDLSSYSRNPSRLSILTSDPNNEETLLSEDSISISPDFNSTIESLLQSLDRQQMVIEDYRSEESRKSSKNAFEDLKRIRKEVWSELRMQQRDQTERERKIFEDKIRAAESLKVENEAKRREIREIMQKLIQKEQLLLEKETDIRAQRLTLEKNKMDWEVRHGKPAKTEPVVPPRGHARANSFSFFSTPNEKSLNPTEHQTLQKTLETLQTELKSLQTLNLFPETQTLENEMKIESLKNKIATTRGQIAIQESNKGSELISTMMESLQKEASREEKMKRVELVQAASKSLNKYKPPLVPTKTNFVENPLIRPKRTEKIDAPIPKAPKKENIENLEKKQKNLMDKEKELNQREKFLQQTWMRVPGAKELLENVNLTLSRLNGEKLLLQKEREAFDKEKFDWSKRVHN